MEQVEQLTNVDPCYSTVVDIFRDWNNRKREKGKSEEIETQTTGG